MEGFTIDTLPDKGLLEAERPVKSIETEKKKKTKRKKQEAWVDEDDKIAADEGLRHSSKYPKKVTKSTQYRAHLVDKFEAIYGRPKWATKAPSRSQDDDDFDLLATAGDVLGQGKRLPKTNLGFSTCSHLAKLPSIVSSVQFHPNTNVASIAGVNGQIDIVKVDEDGSNKLNSVILENFQLNQATFTIDGSEIIIGSKTTFGHFFSYEMHTGSSSRIPLLKGQSRLALSDFALSPDGQYLASVGLKCTFHLLSMNPKEIINTFQLNDEVHCLCFSPDSSKLFAGGDEGLIYVYDVRQTKRCLHRFYDEGALSCRSLAISPNSKYLNTGDHSGLVNSYRYEEIFSSQNPQPIKSFTNLSTSITGIKFNHTSEMVSIASSYSDNSVRLAHVSSCTVYSNFPLPFTNLRRINAMDFSPSSGYLALANNIGYAYLYRLNHFSDY